MQVGYTFSARQAKYLGVPWQQTFEASLGLDTRIVRLGAYWDEIESQPGVYDFRALDWQMDLAAQSGREVVLSVGMKAPRWPEYFLPAWLDSQVSVPRGQAISDDPRVREATLHFVGAVAARYASHPALRYWQVENEPLDPSGPHSWYIRPEFLAHEIETVRLADPQRRPVVRNLFMHVYPLASVLPWSRGDDARASQISQLGDVLGLDVYPSVSLRLLGLDLYFDFSPWNWTRSVQALADKSRARGKQAWIMEAQAEPWEPAKVVANGSGQARSLGPAQASGIFDRLRGSGFETILLWGVEHWYMRREMHQDDSWCDAGQKLLQAASEGESPTASLPPGKTLKKRERHLSVIH